MDIRSVIQARVRVPSDGQVIGDWEGDIEEEEVEVEVEVREGEEKKVSSSDGGGEVTGRGGSAVVGGGGVVIIGSDCESILVECVFEWGIEKWFNEC